MRQLRATKLMKEITPELADAPDGAVAVDRGARSLSRALRRRRPDSLTNAILAGTLLQPLGLAGRRPRFTADALERRIEIGMLPIARRDVERLQHIIAMQPRLLDLKAAAAGAARAAAPLRPRRSNHLDGDSRRAPGGRRALAGAAGARPRRAARRSEPIRDRRRRRRRRRVATYAAPQE